MFLIFFPLGLAWAIITKDNPAWWEFIFWPIVFTVVGSFIMPFLLFVPMLLQDWWQKRKREVLSAPATEKPAQPAFEATKAFRCDMSKSNKMREMYYGGVPKAFSIFYNPTTQRMGIGVYAPRPLFTITPEHHQSFQAVVNKCEKHGYGPKHKMRGHLTYDWIKNHFLHLLEYEDVFFSPQKLREEATKASIAREIGYQRRIQKLEAKLEKIRKT